LKSGSLNLLEPSGPVQACNGIDLPFCNCQGHIHSSFRLTLKLTTYLTK